ncbi:MAG: hypothetical protein F4W68_01645 [Cenarchaeum sp. SB0661_bin_35]|nr:hypothetical protein [Cenarchaeum sp. SB0667_bin_13]MXY38025.1 hypothetical protein [Cenarchaeum sp. SB0664_bin_35]MXZ93288.1 hypothetical protein [Cenarchaeum sp. SB0666_bin_15]MYC79194.1 hypothetical protein [Cenarchaeum sp. SB0661_bin_35]MYD59251.1 hypothetical protein [Cenarchaeum sp. SB0678_bin_8]MYI51308.1 hypothetical protein [Cenarchaeum sp. SB0673_bin_9]MYJ28159.1 hypothetical protein [Cenarchaeum sp. SB0672_bin_9]
MSQKVLAVFMSVGAASGLVAGLILLNLDNNGLTYVEGASISVTTDKNDYKRGEPIQVRVINTGTMPLETSKQWNLRITGLSGMLMYDAGERAYNVLSPGLDDTIVWNQTKNDGNVVLEGLYRISVEGTDADGFTVQDWITVSIWK